MKSLVSLIFMSVLMVSCNLINREKGGNSSAYENQKAEVKEVIQTSSYTYLRVEKNNSDQWIAINKMDISDGEIVYFEDGLEMTNFKSPELGRTFDKVLFVMEISDQPIRHDKPEAIAGENLGTQPRKPELTRLEIRIEQPAGGISIGQLYAKRSEYSGKTVTVRGQVTKVNIGIMGINWVHLQDGTGDGENFDLTVTTLEEPSVGSVVTYSGILALDKDFGYGYFYSLILENAQSVKSL